MCTVTFIPIKDKYVITSNRDEHISRPSASSPAEEIIDNCKIVFPKDPKAGGTWFAVNQKGMVGVLLNGAFEKHIRQENYLMSRGLVLLDLISKDNLVNHFEYLPLEFIEPFTLIYFGHDNLVELRWDGVLKHKKYLDIKSSYIWSSVTLYSKEAISNREILFDDFITTGRNTDENTIRKFHSNNNNDSENGFLINRKNKMKTFSITQAVISLKGIELTHFDLLNNKTYSKQIQQTNLNFLNK